MSLTKILTASFFGFFFFIITPVRAGTLQSSIGYSFSKSDDISHPHGFNIKYGYRQEGSLGMISSFTFMHSSVDDYRNSNIAKVKDEKTLTYYSLGLGPSYKINNYIEAYGLVGYAHISGIHKSNDVESGVSYGHKENSNNNLMYGFGLNTHLSYDTVLNVGYERVAFNDISSNNKSLNIFNLNLGYQW